MNASIAIEFLARLICIKVYMSVLQCKIRLTVTARLTVSRQRPVPQMIQAISLQVHCRNTQLGDAEVLLKLRQDEMGWRCWII